MDVRPLSPAVGAEVLGIDLGGVITDEAMAALTAAFHEYCVLVFREQRLTPASQQAFAACWGTLQDSIGAILRPAAELRRVLERAGAPTLPAAIGWPAEFYREAVRNARLIRNRYTFLDLAAGAGRLEAATS